MCLNVLPACMYVHNVYACWNPGTRVTDVQVLRLQLGSSARATSVLPCQLSSPQSLLRREEMHLLYKAQTCICHWNKSLTK